MANKAGSKVIVVAAVQLHATSTAAATRTVDVKRLVDEATKAIEEIVKG